MFADQKATAAKLNFVKRIGTGKKVYEAGVESREYFRRAKFGRDDLDGPEDPAGQ